MSLERVLRAIPPDGEGLPLAAIADASGVKRRYVSNYCDRLKRYGLVEKPAPNRFRLTAEGVTARDAGRTFTSGPNGPMTGGRTPKRNVFRDRVWITLRDLRRATMADLVTYAAGDDELADDAGERRAIDRCRKFLKQLAAAGYVRKLAPREPGTKPTSNGYAIFLLVEDTGPLTPRYLTKAGKPAIFDPNTGETRVLGVEEAVQ